MLLTKCTVFAQHTIIGTDSFKRAKIKVLLYTVLEIECISIIIGIASFSQLTASDLSHVM